LLESDLLTIMQATTNGTLEETEVKFRDGYAACVIMASDGYPEHYEKGFELDIPDEVSNMVFVAGAKLEDGKLLTNGGRVLGCSGIGKSLEEAIANAYKVVEKVHFDNQYYRHDIGQRALKAIKN
jgi:phosphoribosylamine--glycine ligase